MDTKIDHPRAHSGPWHHPPGSSHFLSIVREVHTSTDTKSLPFLLVVSSFAVVIVLTQLCLHFVGHNPYTTLPMGYGQVHSLRQSMVSSRYVFTDMGSQLW